MQTSPKPRFSNRMIGLGGALLVACAWALTVAAGQPQQLLVASVTGVWKQVSCDNPPEHDGQNPVRWGQTLDVPDTDISGRQPSAGCLVGSTNDSSIVLKSADNALHPFPCEKPEKHQCVINLKHLSENGTRSTFMADLGDACLRLIGKQPERYMVAASRGIEEELTDGVVLQENGQVDLRAIFQQMRPGTYYIEISRADVGAFQGPPTPIVFVKGQPAFVPAKALNLGLYKILLVDQKGEPGNSDAWALSAAGPDYIAKTTAYERARSDSVKLPEEMDSATTRGLLRAYLELLSQTKPGPHS